MNIDRIDEKDKRILDLLRKDGRMTYSDIGADVGLSRVAVAARVKDLEEKGIIRGYTAIVDPVSLSKVATYVVNFDIEPVHFDEVKAHLTALPETVSLMQTSGSCHLMGICVSKDTQAMRIFLNDIFKTVPGLERITFHNVLDVIKGIILPDDSV